MVQFELNSLYSDNYTQAIPNSNSCSDWTQIAALDWQEQLLQHQAVALHTPKDLAINKTIHHFFFEQQNHKKTQHRSNLFMGFPLLFFRRKEKLHSLPVFLWPMEIRPANQNRETWWCQSPPDSRPILNPSIQDFFSFESSALSPQKIIQDVHLLKELSQELGVSFHENETWQPFPKITSLPLSTDTTSLYPGLILGLFPTDHLLSKPSTPIEPVPLGKADIQWWHHLSHRDLDPTQQAALNHFYENPLTLVSGAAGSGKTHLVNNLVINALSNHKKTLLVTNRISTIFQIQETLERLSIDRLGYWLRNPQTDADLLPKLLQQPLKANRIWTNEQKLRHWLRNVDEFQQFKSRQDGAFSAARRSAFGPMNWAQTLGLYLKSSEHGNRALLSIQLNPQDFKLNLEEFTQISTKLGEGQVLFEKIGSIRHPLKRLHQAIFSTYTEADALNFTQSKLHFFLSRLENLQQEHTQLLNQYERQLQGLFEDFYKKESQNIENTENRIANNTTAYGKDFLLTSATSLKLYAPFSERIRTIKKERSKVIEQAQKIQKEFPNIPELDMPYSGQQNLQTVRQVQTFLSDLHETLDQWHDQIPDLIQDHLRRLNYQTAYDTLGLNNEILNLEAALDQTVEAINTSELLDDELTQPMLTLAKRQQKIESLIEFLETIQISLRDFPSFYHWQAFWLSQDKIGQEIIHAIIRSKSKHWQQTFEAWYLQQLLQSKQSALLQEETTYPGKVIDSVQELRHQLPEQINFIWENSRQDAAKYFKKSQLTKRPEQGLSSLKKLFAESGREITQSLPLLIATPEQAISYFNDVSQPIFDLIIFESAQYIDEDLGAYLQGLAKQSFIIGNNQFVIGDDKDDLLEARLTDGIQNFNLAFYHQYYPGHLWQLIRGANITEKAVQKFSIRIRNLDGHYNQELGINTSEVHYIIEHLRSRERTGQRTYPSIAVVCNTIEQRNFISKAILDIKREGNEEEKNDFLQMERNGLMVLHLGELAAYRFDVLIYSFTFTPKTGSSVSNQINLLNSPAGVRQLNELMSVGKSEIQIVHCLSSSLMEDWSQNPSQEGFFLFANYLKMLNAIHQGNAEKQSAIGKILQNQYQQSSSANQSTPFYDEITIRLGYFLPDAKFTRHFSQANIRFPLIVEHEDYPNQKIAVISDYFLSDYAGTSISWENNQRKKYATLGFHCVPTYSINWWKNPDQAAESLANEIVKKWEEERST